ncbi:MAG: glycerophosphodiester phosphodiesterase [Erysipelotrichaceae bacterium]
MTVLKKVGMVLLAIVLLVVGANGMLTQSYAASNPWRSEGRPLVIAHGGAKDLNPENTMKAFQHAFDLGVDVLEIDLMMTQDHILVTHHGSNQTGNIDLMSDGAGLVHEMTYEQLRQYNFGYNFVDLDGNRPYKDYTLEQVEAEKIYLPRLEELFEAFSDQVLYIIEVKADGDAPRLETVDALYDLIDAYALQDHVIVASFYDDINAYYNKTRPEIAVSPSRGVVTKFVVTNLVKMGFLFAPQSHAAMQLPLEESAPVIGTVDLTNPAILKQAHRQNMGIHYWTINDEATMQALIDLGADGIITDRPDLLIDLINQNN